MESLVKDPELASEIIKLYGKELKAAEERIAELEQAKHSTVEPGTSVVKLHDVLHALAPP
jgi:hypothetical protein